jgi:hypothetical protein
MRLSIGAGARRLPGWTHVDIDPALAPDLLADIREPLPLPDASVECIFCEEVLTQIEPEACLAFLRDCRRLLQPGGVVRVLMPDLQRFVRAYLDRPEWLVAIWDKHVAIPLFTGTACEVLNRGLRAVGPFVYDRATFEQIAARAGMVCEISQFNRSRHPALDGLDMRGPEETLTVYYELWLSAE